MEFEIARDQAQCVAFVNRFRDFAGWRSAKVSRVSAQSRGDSAGEKCGDSLTRASAKRISLAWRWQTDRVARSAQNVATGVGARTAAL